MKRNLLFSKTALVFLMTLSSVWGSGQLFQQQFGSSTTVSDYVQSSTPSNGQFNAISSSGTGWTWSINNEKLRFNWSAANNGSATRTTDFGGNPTSLMIRFDLQISNNSLATTGAFYFSIGDGYTTANSGPAGTLTHSRFAINTTTTNGTFAIRKNESTAANSSSLSGNQTITWVINNSGSSMSYTAPDGSSETVANDTWDIWAGTTKIFNDIAALTSTQLLNELKIYGNTSATVTTDIDNFLIDPIPSISTSNSASNITSSGFTANWTPVSGVTGYRVDVSSASDFSSFVAGYNNVYVSGQSTNNLIVSGLNPGTQYYYRVRAVSQYAVGEFGGGNSSSQSATTLAASPTWNGTSWDNGTPSASTAAVINANYSAGSFTAQSVTVNSGFILNINANEAVTTGNIINNGAIIVNNDGSLIQNTGSTYSGTGTFTVNKTGASAANKYAFWASPVANQNLTTIFGATTPQFITEYITATNYFVNAATTSVDGKGYSIKNPVANAAVSFVGTPNNNDITFNLNTASLGYNLVGNPYPSDLNLVDFYNANSAKIGSTFYFWDSNSDPVVTQTGNTTTNVGYATYNPSTQAWVPAPNVLVNPTGNVAKVAQGFFVQATNPSDTSLSFTNAMRTSAAGTFFNKNNSSLEGKYWVKLSSSYNTNNTFVVAYLNGASNAFDAYDSKALGTGSDAFYTFAGAEKLIIQGKGSFYTSDVVPVGAKHFETGNFTISLTQKEGVFTNGQAIYLHDMLLGTYTNLQNTSYNFTANAGEIADRFEIVYQLGTLSTSEAQKGGFEVYRQGDDFYVRNSKNIEKVEVYDAVGRKTQEVNAGTQLVKIHIDTKGFYIIKAKSAGKEYTKKITY